MLNKLAGFRGFKFFDRRVGLIFSIVCALASIEVALAADAAVLQSGGSTRFAIVSRIHGDVSAVGVNGGTTRQLREGDALFVGERVSSSAISEAVLKTDDGGMIAVRPGAVFIAERFAAEGKATDNFVVRLLTGSFRVITGWIGKVNRAEHRIITPTATLGVRGTDHETYVLSPEMAVATSNREGTYDKVNRGGTTMEVGKNKLDIDAGRVGFAPAAPKSKDRALLTLLLPVLLDKVPNFFVPGKFDAELDQYSLISDESSQKLLDQKKKETAATPVAECVPLAIGTLWLEELDASIARADAPNIIAMFAPDVSVHVTVRGNDGALTAIDLDREQLVQSTLASIKDLKDYKQRRVSTEARLADVSGGGACQRIVVKSVVIEQGVQSGKPYRFESLEEYLLVHREGRWLSLKAESTQR